MADETKTGVVIWSDRSHCSSRRTLIEIKASFSKAVARFHAPARHEMRNVSAVQFQKPSVSSAFNWTGICRAAGVAAFVFLIYCLATMVQIASFGGPPDSIAEAFRALQQNKLLGLLRLDFATVLVLPLYYLLFFGLFAALRDTNRTHAAIGTVLVFLGVTLVLAMPTALPLMALSDKYATATSEAMKAHFLAAGEAVLATDIWHGTGAYMGGLFVQTGAVWISFVMLRGVFSKATAYVGIITHGLDLVHILFAPFLPKVAAIFMIVSGLGYPVWLFLAGRRLLKLGNAEFSEARAPLPPALEGK